MLFCSNSFRKFIDILSSDTCTPKVASQALQQIAPELRIGKMTVHIIVPETPFLPNGEEHDLVLYDCGGKLDNTQIHEHIVHTGDGGEALFRVIAKADADSWSQEEQNAIGTVVDICCLHASRFRLIGMIEQSALTQYLSGLPNGGGYLKRVGEVMARGEIEKYDAYYFNLKGTSVMNVKFGQHEGDAIIKRYARILNSELDKDEILGHLGGDTFVALIRKEHENSFSERIGGVETYAEVEGGRKVPVWISTTVGLMRIDSELPGVWMVISGPAIACQSAKAQGQNCVVLTQEMVIRSNRAKIVENTFYDALANGEFCPFYQPKVDMQTGKIVGAEVLARWVVNGKVVPPMDFIPVLERTGEIPDLDLYILEQACIDLNRWKSMGIKTVPLSVNISRRDVEIPDLAQCIQDCLRRNAIGEEEIFIEVTETANEHESSLMKKFVDQLLDGHIMTSIDDFGTGYSSLGFLRELPVRELKIDRSFINHPALQNKDRVIIGTIIGMAKELGVDVITEGVETKDQVDFLLGLGCSRAQGFLFDRPLPKDQFECRIKEGFYSV